MKKLALHWQIFIAMFLGGVLGFLARQGGYTTFVTDYVAVLGELFLRLLRMIIVPLIFTSIVSGVSGIGGGKNLGRLGLKTFLYYVSTSLFAILTGLIMVNIFRPGVGAPLSFEETPTGLSGSVGQLADTLIGIIPTNPFQAMAETDILSVIFFALLVGFFITRMEKEKGRFLNNFFQYSFDLMMRLTGAIIKLVPIGVFALIADLIAKTGFAAMKPLGLYMFTVMLGLFVHAVVTLPSIVRIVGRLNPFRHAQAMSPALLTAFSTSSSSATLPLTIESIEERAGVSNKISSFTLPLGATVNMDGTALYECVAAMFIAQAYGIELSFGAQMVVVVTALLASIGAAGIPMAGLVMISNILSAVGLPLEGLGLILAVDRVLDMTRTMVNVWSDSCGAAVIANSEGEIGAGMLRPELES